MATGSVRDWENPAVFGINKRKAHVNLRSYTNQDQIFLQYANLEDGSPSPRYHCLDGKDWRFKLYRAPESVPDNFHVPEYDDSKWNEISVPGMWEMQGFGIPQYLNFEYPFPINPPFVPEENPCGCYRLEFQSPLEHESLRAFLVLEAVDSAFYCWMNGSFIGYSQDSRLPAEFDVTKLLIAGQQNVLAIKVLKWSDGSYLEDQDMWRMSGIQRSVYILYKPKTRIEDFKVTTPIEFSAESPGSIVDLGFEAQVDVSQDADSSIDISDVQVRMQLFRHSYGQNPDTNCTNIIWEDIGSLNPIWLARDSTLHYEKSSCGFRSKLIAHSSDFIEAPRLWSAETPNSYILIISLELSNKQILEMEGSLVGFRKTWISSNGQLLHNGQPIILKGVNRHEHDQYTGRIVSSESMKIDAQLMKRYNFNAVRCSHYPSHSLWYEICTVLGLYVIDEANFETHGFDPSLQNNPVNPACASEWTASIVDRGVRMYHRDKNMPCIVLWSLGNEAGYGPAHLAMAGYIRTCDDTRPIHYEGGGSRTPATDVICPMYARIEQVEALALDPNEKRPVILCEYAHSMGNSTGNVDKYWNTFNRLEKCQGGFIWDWADQALIKRFKNKNGNSIESWAYGGDFGDFPNDAQFICNGVVFPDRSLKPAALEMKHVQSPISCSLIHKTREVKSLEIPLRIQVRNKNFFSSTEAYDFTWRALVNGDPAALYGSWQNLELKVVQPQHHTILTLPITLDEFFDMASTSKCPVAEVCLEIQCCLKHTTNWVEKGHVVSIQQLLLPTQYLQIVNQQKQQEEEASSMSISIADRIVTIRSLDGMHECEIDNRTGSLIRYSVESSRENVLANPITPCLYRAPTDNDRGGSGGKSYAARWKSAGLHCLETLADSCTVTPIFHGDRCTGVVCTFKLHPDRDQAQTEIHDEGVGVGEVGGSHWFAENDQNDGSGDEGHDTPVPDSFDALIYVSVTYSFLSNGSLHSSWSIDASKSLPPYTPKGLYPSLPRVGVRFAIPGCYESVDWYGRGPQECYPDRKAGSRMGHFSADCISELHVPYIFPGECDGRSDVRWTRWSIPNSTSDTNTQRCIIVAALRSSTSIPGAAASLESQDVQSASLGVQVSSSFYSLEDLENAKHEHELDQSKHKIFVHVDAAHMGVGGDDSWSPTVHPEFLVPPGRYCLDLVIQANAPPESVWSSLLLLRSSKSNGEFSKTNEPARNSNP